MTKENEKVYPVKTLHEFLYEIDRERSKFKRGALIGIFISSLLLIALVFVYIQLSKRGLVTASDIILAVILVSFLVYSLYLMAYQYRFFRKWEKRMTRLSRIEEELMPEKTENPS
ncbi:MAG: hypothetical protein NWE98_08055 [Candidatus Bathyarchaeota archaeon]|nr:hypothetical protein [Candidatus Bathyarchaeota archaeon]